MARTRREGEFFLDYQRSVWQHQLDGDDLIMAAPQTHPAANDNQRPNTPGKLAKLKRLRLFCQMREEIHSILDLQANYTDEAMGGLDEPLWEKHQRRLDELYGEFVQQFDSINRVELRQAGRPNAEGEYSTYKVRPNLQDFREDPDAYLVASVEIYNEHTEVHKKSNIFTERVIAAKGIEPEFDIVRDALMYCVGERGYVDLDYVATLTEKATEDVVQELIETHAIFQNPQTGGWELAEKYLTGNICEKLVLAKKAAETEPFYAANVEALIQVLPVVLKPEQISINLGMPWIPIDILEQFAREVLEVSAPQIQYVSETHTWFATGGASARDATDQFSTKHATPIHILQASLNNKPVNPEGRDMVDRDAAAILAREKQEIIDEKFKSWAWEDPQRAERLAELYNQHFNSTVLREYDGAHLSYPGQSVIIGLRPHQNDAVWRNMEHGNTLYGHEVGAGKTWAAATAAMEMRRLGRVQKPCFVVPNHLLDQWARDYKLLYPNAKLLVLSDEQFRERGKKINTDAKLEKFVNRAANQDCDAIILTQSNFDRLPATPEIRLEILLKEMNEAHALQERHAGGDWELERYFNNIYRHKRNKLQKFLEGVDPDMEIEEEIDSPSARDPIDDDMSEEATDVTHGTTTQQHAINDEDKIDEFDSSATNRLDRLMKEPVTSATWKPYLAKIREQEARDYYGDAYKGQTRPYFEDMKADYLFIDEGQDYKNLGIASRLEGMTAQPSAKAASLYAKTYQLRKEHPNYYLSVMTGTPISNTLSEMYNLQRYMQEPLLEEMGIHNFDAWVSMFADYVSSIEMTPEGGSYRVVSRLARYKNVPELLKMFLDFADIVTGDMLDLPKPKLKDGKHQIIRVPRGKVLEDYIDQLSDRADAIHNREVKPSEDNMLKVTNNGRLAALHPALVGITPEPGFKGKIDYLSDEVADRYQRYKDNVYKDAHGNDEPIKGALQMVFCDIGTPKRGRSFSAYGEIKRQLIERGVPEKQIRFIHECKTDRQKEELFEDCRRGKVSVLIGTTQKLGTGTNVQKRLIAQHHLDAPWRPGDIDQRDGRILRQGNQNKEVEILRYVVEGSFDTYMWQTLERKAKFIAQIMRGDLSIRTFEDNDTNALSYAEVKALASGDPLILEKAGVDNDFARINRLRAAHEQGNARAHREIMFAERNILEHRIHCAQLTPALKAIQQADPALYPLVLEDTKPQPEDKASRLRVGRKLKKQLRDLREEAQEKETGLSRVVGSVYGYTVTAHVKHELRVITKREREDTKGKQSEKVVAAKKSQESRIQHVYTMELCIDDPTHSAFPVFAYELANADEPKKPDMRKPDMRKGLQGLMQQAKIVGVKSEDIIAETIVERVKRLQKMAAYEESQIEHLTKTIEDLRGGLGKSFEQQDEFNRILAKKQKIDALLEENAKKKKEEKASGTQIPDDESTDSHGVDVSSSEMGTPVTTIRTSSVGMDSIPNRGFERK